MDLQQIRNGLAALKATPIKAQARTKKAIIKELAEDIRELRAAGHSFASILEIIAAGGVELKESTLKKYLIDCAPKKKAKTESEERCACDLFGSLIGTGENKSCPSHTLAFSPLLNAKKPRLAAQCFRKSKRQKVQKKAARENRLMGLINFS